VLSSYQKEDLEFGIEGEAAGELEGGDEDEGDEESRAEWVELQQPGASIRQTPPSEMPSVFKEEGLNGVQIAMVVIGVLVVIGLVAVSMGR
jgi:hypothetical protein